MAEVENASVGAIAGSSGDAGVEYRRAVAAYAAACGLASVPLLGFGVGPAQAQVAAVHLETDDEVDDIRVEFESPWVVFVQAKLTLKKGKPLRSAVAQWTAAANAGLDPTRQRLVIVAGELNGPMRILQAALELYKTDSEPSLTKKQAAEIAHLEGLLEGLTAEQMALVKRCGMIHELSVLEEKDLDAREAALILDRVLSSGQSATDAWMELVGIAGWVARRRGGLTIQGWLNALRSRGFAIDSEGEIRSAELERLHQAIGRHFESLRRAGGFIDLRGLGAELPPIPISEIDAEVKVEVRLVDDYSSEDLVWAFLRRGRMVLTGLPGSGKSAALLRVAMHLTEISPESIPLVVPLKLIDLSDGSRGIGEKLIAVALRDLATTDRSLLAAEIDRRLSRSGLTLILDGLDETYARRSAIVQELDTFLAGVSSDIDVILSTRDVAYGQAATLGWPSLGLLEPKEVERTIDSILQSAYLAGPADQRDDQTAEDFAQPRRSWVLDALRRDATLKETPLLPVLLCLLAVERAPSALPESRAAILAAVVRGVVDRREGSGPESLKFGQLSGAEAALAALDSFAIEASHILTHGGVSSVSAVVEDVSKALRVKWGLSKGHAQVAGTAILHFWDESGIFVISGADERVTPRVMLFAEVGDALRAVGGPAEEVEAWVARRLADQNIEPVVLAGGLSPIAAASLAEEAIGSSDRDLLHATLRAVREGAVVEGDALAQVAAALLADVAHADWEGWQSWLAVLSLDDRLRGRDELVAALDSFSPERQMIGNALIALRCDSPDDLRRNPKVLLDAMAVMSVGALSSRTPMSQDSWRRVDRSLTSVIVESAELLVGHSAEAEELALQHLGHGPVSLQQRLSKLLARTSVAEEAAAAVRLPIKDFAALQMEVDRWQSDTPSMVLKAWAAWPSAQLDHAQATRLGDLGDFVATLNLNSTDLWGDRTDDWWPELVDTVLRLGAFDGEVIASEAQVVLDRMAVTGDDAAFFALLDLATDRELSDWSAIEDVEHTVDLLVGLQFKRLGVAQVAAACLWGQVALADVVVPRLSEIIPKLARSDRHQRAAAWLLRSIGGPQVTEQWVEDSSPVLRGVAARSCDGVTGGVVSDDLRRFLNDDDGHVREEALQRLAETDAEDRLAALEAAAAGPDPRWLCFSCGTLNTAGAAGCAKDGCFRAGARPSEVARKLLAGLEVEDQA